MPRGYNNDASVVLSYQMVLVELHFSTRCSSFIALVVKDVPKGMTSSFQFAVWATSVTLTYRYSFNSENIVKVSRLTAHPVIVIMAAKTNFI